MLGVAGHTTRTRTLPTLELVIALKPRRADVTTGGEMWTLGPFAASVHKCHPWLPDGVSRKFWCALSTHTGVRDAPHIEGQRDPQRPSFQTVNDLTAALSFPPYPFCLHTPLGESTLVIYGWMRNTSGTYSRTADRSDGQL